MIQDAHTPLAAPGVSLKREVHLLNPKTLRILTKFRFCSFSATAEKNYIFFFHARSFPYAAIIIDALHESENKTSYKHFWLHSIMTGLILERTFLEELLAIFQLAIKTR
ncbi:MAG: hypothetical protein WC840_07775 [Candidatus Peribacteraceae bacterium]